LVFHWHECSDAGLSVTQAAPESGQQRADQHRSGQASHADYERMRQKKAPR